jgi:hypothetical protein
MCNISKLDKCSKNDDFKIIHINLIGHIQCISNSRNNEKFKSLSFKQGTPCQSHNNNNVYGSKHDAHIITNILI